MILGRLRLSRIHCRKDTLQQQLVASGHSRDAPEYEDELRKLIQLKLTSLADKAAGMAAVLKAYCRLRASGDLESAHSLLAWLRGDPHVPTKIKQLGSVRGDLDEQDAKAYLRGLLEIIRFRQSGLVLILDEVETALRLPSDLRQRSWQALREWTDDIAECRYPGLYLVLTGTPELFTSEEGIRSLPPLHQRLSIDEPAPGSRINYYQPQIPLFPFDRARLRALGKRVREIYPSKNPDRLAAVADDKLLETLLLRFQAHLNGKEITPRLFLRKWIDLLDQVDLYEDFVPDNNMYLDAHVGGAEAT